MPFFKFQVLFPSTYNEQATQVDDDDNNGFIVIYFQSIDVDNVAKKAEFYWSTQPYRYYIIVW